MQASTSKRGQGATEMLQTVWATVRDGRIEPVEPVELPEGSRMIITIIPDEEPGDWLRISELALDTVWDNPEDDIYGELLKE
jgi:predicted DNA-binding antitoxin AbrB/MazE fold protein